MPYKWMSKLKPSIYRIIILVVLISSVLNIDCATNTDCRRNYDCIENTCKHKKFFPITLVQIFQAIFLMLFSSVATSCGVGGGAIFSTFLMILDSFDSSLAFPISNFIILFCSLSVYLIGASEQNPDIPNHDFVDYDLVLIICPMLLLGTKIGVILNGILPSIFLKIILIYTVYGSTTKIWNNYKKAKLKEEQLEINPETINEKEEVKSNKIQPKYSSEKALDIINKLKKLNVLKTDLFEEKQPIKWTKIRIMAELLFLLIIDQLIEGSAKVSSIFNLKRCSFYWNLTQLVFFIIIFTITKLILIEIREEKKMSDLLEIVLIKKGQEVKTFSINECTNSELNSLLINSFVAGIIAGMLGIGGGMIITPMFLQLGVSPQATISTSNFLLIFSSCSSTIQFILAGQLMLDYSIIYSLLCMFSSIIGYKVLSDYVKKTGKNSFLLLSLFWVMLFSLIVLPLESYNKLKLDISNKIDIFAIKKFC